MDKRISGVVVVALLGMLLLGACGGDKKASSEATADQQGETALSKYAGKKIYWIESYHEGYAWSDGVSRGIHKVLDGTGVQLRVMHMDTKRNPSVAYAEFVGKQVKADLEAFKPDVVIASDDNAQKYVVVPFFKGTDLPVVFCGVNWDASVYGYPTTNVTGMVEVELPAQLIEQLKPYAKGSRVAYLTVDSETERKVVQAYNDRFFNGQLQAVWVTTYDELTAKFLELQQEADIVFLGNNAGIDRWDEAEARQFFVENTQVPTGAVYDWLAPYVLITLAKQADEQGEWAAQTALRILDGTPPSDIPLVENQRGFLYVNLDIAGKLGIVFPPATLRNAIIVESAESTQP